MQPKFCRNCGAALSPSASFCNKCGTRIDNSAENNPIIQQSYAQPPRTQVEQTMPVQMPPQGVYSQPERQYANAPGGNGKEVVGIIIGIVLLLGVLMMITFLSKESEGAVQATQSDNVTQTENKKNNSKEKQQESNTDETQESLRLGEMGYYEGLAIKLNGVRRPNPETLYDQPAENMEYILLDIEVTNESSDILDCPGRNCFTLVIDGNQYINDQLSVYLPEDDKYGGDPLEAGQIHRFSPLYQVPVGTKDYEVLFVPGFDGEKLTYRFSIESLDEVGMASDLYDSEADYQQGLSPEQCSTTDRPETEDFSWFTTQADDWIYGITPSDAQMIDAFEMTEGSWKGMEIIYDYDGTILCYAYFTLTFSGEPEEVMADIHWHHMQWADGTREELVYREDEKMIGEFAYAGFNLGGPGNQIDLLCYERNGRQYAEGIWTVQSGEEVRVALARP